MTNIKGKITLLICLVLSLVMLFTLSSCGGNDDTNSNTQTGTNTDTGTDSSTDTSTDTSVDTGTDDSKTDTSVDSGSTDSSTDESSTDDSQQPDPEPEPAPIVTYIVTFVQEGFVDVAKTVNEGDTLTDIPTPQAVQGYEIKWEEKDLTNIQTDITVNAVKTPIEYDIIYVLNGGTNNDENPNSYNVEQSFELKAPAKEGYTFAGWYNDIDFNNLESGIALGSIGEKPFYAKWIPNENTIVFNANGGTGTMSNMTIATDSTVNLTPIAFTKAGYTFIGWSTSANSSVVYADETSYTMGTEESYTLYAVWQANENTIVFNANGGNGTMSNMTIATDSSANLTTNTFTKAGYTFIGWSTAENGDVEYIDCASYTMGTEESYTLYAVWQAKENTLVFNANGGSGAMENMTIETDDTVKLTPNAFTKAGYTFVGWSTAKNGDVEYIDCASYTMGTGSTYVLYAVWQANENTLVFNANGGTGTMANMTIETDASANLKSNAFVRAGYTFKGWATSANGDVVYTNGASYTMGTNNSYTLYAVWERIDYSITYVLNGGTNNSQNISSYNIEKSFTLKDARKTGYTFSGWYSDSSFNNKVTEIALGTTGNKIFYAKWTANENTLIFNANGGSGAMPNMTIATDSTVKLTNNAFTKAGYTFKGWATSKDGSVKYSNGASYTMGTESTYTLYAVWEKNINGLVFNGNGATSGSMSSIEIATGDTASIPNNSFIRNGYTFIGWSTSANGSVVYTNGASYTMGTNSSYILYAVWQVNTYNITYVLNGGTNNTNSTTYTVEQEFAFKAPTKTGYTFAGWYSDSAFNNKVTGVSLGTTGNKTFYAKWTANENTLVFNANGGTGSMPNMTIATDSTVKLTSNAFTKDGYTFIGWATSKDGSVKYSNGASYTMGTESTYTLYAVWEKNINGLIFNGNGATSGSMSSVEIATGDTASIPNNSFIRNGYTFIGWSTSANGSVVYTNGASYTMGTGSTYVLYAVWQANENTIVFNGNGATGGSTQSMTVKTDETATLSSNKFAKTGYTFKGWSTSANGTVAYKNGASYTMGTDSVYTLYAVWEANLNTIIFNGNGATGGSTQSMTVATDSTATLNQNGFVRDGYTFRGWSTTKDGSIKYSNGASYTMGRDSTYTLYAVWRANENTLAFNGNGATGGSTPSMTIATDATAELTANGFVRDGYTFVGWSTSASGSVKYTDGASYTMDTSVQYTLYAVWEAKENTLVFDGNGATSGSMSDMIIATDNTDILINNKFAKTGYTFKGWSSTKNGSVEYQNGSAYTMGAESVATLYAVWEANKNTIVFNGNGATGGSMVNMTVATDSTAALTNNLYTKTGYHFIGWSTTKDGSVVYTNSASYTMGTNSSYTLYAIWEANENTLVFNANSGLGNMSNMTISTDETVNLASNKFVKAGYTFVGWATSANGGVVYENGASYKMGTNSSYTLYAVWQANENTLIFNANGGSGSMPNMTIETDDTVKLTNAFTKTGYTFKGWSTSTNGSVAYADGASYTMGTNSSYTLYAVWEANQNIIVFNANGGSGTMENMTIETDGSANLTINTFTRAGYTFIGWSTSENGSVIYDDEASYTMGSNATYTLYAVWQIETYDITYILNGGTNNSGNPTTYTVEQTTSLLDPSKEFYTFAGWYVDEHFTTQITSIEKGTINDITLYAKWNAINYKITYDTLVTGNPRTFTVEDLPVSLVAPEVGENQAFAGWYTTSDFSDEPTMQITQIGAIKLYAKIVDSTEGVVFTDNGDTCSVTDYTGTSTNVIIPSSVMGKKVTSIGSSAFNYCTSLASVTIGDSVTSIGDSAFYNCTSLTSVTIPDSVTSIGNSAFEDCTNLTEINFNAKAMNDLSSSNYVFYNAGINGEGIKVTIGKEVTKIPAYLFASSQKITSVEFEEGSVCESIGNYAFEDCTSLTSVTIPDSVESIGYNAFYNCTSLTSITIPNSVTSIGNYAFAYCRNLTSILIPDSVTSIGGSAFSDCTGLTSVTIGEGVTSIGSSAFEDCTSLTSVTIPDSVESIGYNAFYNCTSLTSVTIGEGVTSIGSSAFDGCDSLTSVTIPDSVTSIGNYAFEDCTSLTSVTIGEGVTNIGDYAFSGCTSLTEINFNAKAMYNLIEDNCVFYNAGKNGKGIKVTIGKNVTKIPTYLFCPYDYDSLYSPKITSVTFEEGSVCESIGYDAFKNCTSLTSVTIPDSVTSIGNYAFCGCTGLTSIIIPNSVTSIGDYAFEDCTSLQYNEYDNAYYLGNEENPHLVLIKAKLKYTSITFCTINENTRFIYSSAFDGCDSLTSVTIPDSVTSIGSYAFEYCTSLTSLTIGEGVTNIGDYAFSGCTALTEINLNSIAMDDFSYNNYVFSNAGKNGEGIKVTIGKEVTKIPAYLFCPYISSSSYSPKITSVTIPDSVTRIGSSAFSGCTSLTSVTIPDSVTSIGSYAFSGCTSLTSVTIPDSVTSIGSYAFQNCNSLTIYCEAESKPSGWHYRWNNSYCPVVWGIEIMRIYFETNGGATIKPIFVNGVNTTTTTLPTPVKPHYEFAGWYENADFSGEPITSPNFKKGKITLYAKWELYKGESFEKAMLVESGNSYDITIDESGELIYLAITPTETKEYTISSSGDYDVIGYLYNSSQEMITYEDGDIDNFTMTETLTAGQTYYIVVEMYDQVTTGSFTLTIN